ncbi:hypothetical protein VNO78_21099 [Psophocarpus tetragonolobus]|uniref:poly(A)-specific ribonuclease n=1 Tax=Psophocarpus tetragonolobus TaxID=3891 RepID=A0AAN9SBH1_PSOTE
MILTRSVWASNLESEFDLIGSLVDTYPLISIDTEFPGVVVQSDPALRHRPEYNYRVMKANVDRLHLIQLGLTLSDYEGNLPSFRTSNSFVWEFNFCEFDVGSDLYAPDSIELLRGQGIDFESNHEFGVQIQRFAELMKQYRLVCNPNIQWITFHGASDFGYLVKALTSHGVLPQSIHDFIHLVKYFFGLRVYDVKHLIKFCPNLYGGLEKVAGSLNLKRAHGESHQAASDSLLTLKVFMKINEMYFERDNDQNMLLKLAGILHTIEVTCVIAVV